MEANSPRRMAVSTASNTHQPVYSSADFGGTPSLMPVALTMASNSLRLGRRFLRTSALAGFSTAKQGFTPIGASQSFLALVNTLEMSFNSLATEAALTSVRRSSRQARISAALILSNLRRMKAAVLMRRLMRTTSHLAPLRVGLTSSRNL